MDTVMDVSIIIVNYNTRNLIRNCLVSIYQHTCGISFEVIVSDNGSTDGSLETIKREFPQVLLIENNANLGFGAANNKALSIAKGKYVFYLNSDTVLLNNAVKIFYDFWENSSNKEKIGAVGGVLLDEKLETIHSGSFFPTYKSICRTALNTLIFHWIKSFVKIFGLQQWYLNKKRAISLKENVIVGETDGYVTGADLFMLNNEYAKFDENFFMYYEETDMQLKLKEAGYKRFIIDGPKIQHLTRKLDALFSVVGASDIYMQKSAVYYSQKHVNPKSYLLRFIIWLDMMNPYVRNRKTEINRNSMDLAKIVS